MRYSVGFNVIISILITSYAIVVNGQIMADPIVPDSSVPQILKRMGHRVVVDARHSTGASYFRIAWQSAKEMPGGLSTTQGMQFLKRIDRRPIPPKQRSGEISQDHLVVIVLDTQGTVRHWRSVIDPRLVRGEFPDDQGNLHSHIFYLSDVTFDIPVPDTINAAEIQILSPSWEGEGILQLSPVFAVKLQ